MRSLAEGTAAGEKSKLTIKKMNYVHFKKGMDRRSGLGTSNEVFDRVERLSRAVLGSVLVEDARWF